MRTDEEVPKRPRGRPIRSVSIKECLKVEKSRANGETCSLCPKYEFKQHYCPILAQLRKPEVAACKYGKLLIAIKKRNLRNV